MGLISLHNDNILKAFTINASQNSLSMTSTNFAKKKKNHFDSYPVFVSFSLVLLFIVYRWKFAPEKHVFQFRGNAYMK